MKNITRAHRLDSAQQSLTDIGPMPQDSHNYLRQSSYLSLGRRLECGNGIPGSDTKGIKAATSAGGKL